MKFSALLAILSLTMAFNTASATEMAGADDDLSYCNEQVQLAGIEDAEEKNQYVKDCMDSMGTPQGDYQQPGQ